MRILFLGQRYTYFRNFDSVLRELDAHGHVIRLAVDKENEEGRPLVEALTADCPNITFGEAPERADDDWGWAATRLRHGLDYLRYQRRLFDETPKLRARSRERTPGGFVTLGDFVRRFAPWSRRLVSAVLHWLERSIPEDPAIRTFVEQQQPDLVLISPLITLGSSQIDYLRAARSLGIPTALCVWSWDHLSSKALIRDLPDRVFVWNDTQKQEAIELHGVSADRIVVTGAQCFDRWFERKPSRDRESFCSEIGLPASQPFILYVCSAPFRGSEPEAPFVAEWIRQLRESRSSRLRNTPVLVRPHPSRHAEWASIDLSRYRNVSLWGGNNPVDDRSRADYFDSLYHSAAVVGLNTSAFIEAAIVGRPVHTILLPEWHESQMGTVHFRYLFESGGGLLISASSFDEHMRQLDSSLEHPSTEIKPFVRSFVRPHGLDVPATPIFVKEVEQLEGLATEPMRTPRFERLARWAVLKALPWRTDIEREQLVYSERELESILRVRAMRQEKAERRRAERESKRQAAGSMR